MDQSESQQVIDPELAALEQMISADEASDTSADNADRAGSELTFEPLDPDNGPSALGIPDSDSGTRPAKPAATPATPPPVKPDQKPADGQEGQQKPAEHKPAEAQQSRYQKAREREAKAWKEINEAKAQAELERTQLEAERAQLRQERVLTAQRRQAQARTQQNGGGEAELMKFTAEQYEDAALNFEAEGDQAMADKAWAAARDRRAVDNGQAPAPRAQAATPQQRPQTQQAWAKAKAEFPEIIQAGSPANKAMQAFIQAHPDVLDHPHGPYLAAQLVVAQTRAAQVPQLQTEAARVPELTKQVETLTAKVKELLALTSLPSSHLPTSAANARGETPWGSKSLAEMEAELDRELANA